MARLLFSEPSLTEKLYVLQWEGGGGERRSKKLFSTNSTRGTFEVWSLIGKGS